MPSALDKLAFNTAQAARVSWFFGQKLLASRMGRPVPMPEAVRKEQAGWRERLWVRALPVNGEFPKHLAYFLGLESRPRNENDAIRTYTLPFAMRQDLLGCAVPGNQQTPESVSRNTTLFETKFSQPLLTGNNLDAQLPAVFSSHGSLERLHYRTRQAAVVGKGLGTIMNRNASQFAEKFIMRRFISVLESSPPAYVINQNGFVLSVATGYVV